MGILQTMSNRLWAVLLCGFMRDSHWAFTAPSTHNRLFATKFVRWPMTEHVRVVSTIVQVQSKHEHCYHEQLVRVRSDHLA